VAPWSTPLPSSITSAKQCVAALINRDALLRLRDPELARDVGVGAARCSGLLAEPVEVDVVAADRILVRGPVPEGSGEQPDAGARGQPAAWRTAGSARAELAVDIQDSGARGRLQEQFQQCQQHLGSILGREWPALGISTTGASG
jgi:hypothetical protein